MALVLARIRSWWFAFTAAVVVLVVGATRLWFLYEELGAEGAVESSSWVPWLRIATCFTVGCLLNVGWLLLPESLRRGRGWDVTALAAMAGVLVTVAAHPLLALTVLAVLAAIIAVGAAMYYLVEEPSRKGLRRVTQRHLGRVPPPEPAIRAM